MSPRTDSSIALSEDATARSGARPGTIRRTLLTAWPLLTGLTLFWTIVAVLLIASLRRTGGHLVYALDDPYIHMAIAKNFSQHGVWGVTRYGFTSSNSSLLWPLLLSASYLLFGVNAVTPLVLGILSASLVLLSGFWILRWYRIPPLFTFVALTLSILLIPLPALTFEGLEHPLHIALTLLVTFLSARYLTRESPGTARRDAWLLIALGPLVVAARFEGMFVILAISALLLLRPAPEFGRRARYALCFAISGFLPVAVFGAISRAQGWEWLPNTLLLKGRFPELTSPVAVVESLVSTFQGTMLRAPHLWGLLLLILLLYVLAFRDPPGAWESRQVMSAIFIAAALLHMEFADTGFFFRYEAYLVALALLIAAAQIRDYLPHGIATGWLKASRLPQYTAIALLAGLVSVPLGVRAWWALVLIPRATANIYQQQYQMGIFVKTYYQGSVVALNDIGAVNYFADVHCLDLWGLSNLEVMRKRRRDAYHTEDIARAAKSAGARIALVYDEWFQRSVGSLPHEWALVGSWTIRNTLFAGSDTVSIYAVDPSEASRLAEHLHDFSRNLPQEVIQRGSYTDWAGAP